jgi:hypothetical integral membrane protein (TIGR02206 family)
MGVLLQSKTRFLVFGTSHITVLFLSAVLGCALVLWARRGCSPWAARLTCWALGLTTFLGETAFALFPILEGTWSPTWALPIQLCDVVAFLALPALVTRNQFLVEVLYYWAFTGTLLASLTPEMRYDFPHIEFFCFFASHTLVVVAAAFLVFGLGQRPRKGSFLRVFLAVNVYGVLIVMLNAYLGSNYLFLNQKPQVASPYDYLGPWPFYVVAVDVILLTLMAVLSLPFRVGQDEEAHLLDQEE